MSDTSQGEGWWQASDGKWYPPEAVPGPDPNETVAWDRPSEPPSASPFEPPSPSPFEPPASGPSPGYGSPAGGIPPAGPPPGYGTPPAGPPPGYGPPPAGQPPGYGPPGAPPAGYGAPAPANKSSRTVWIVLAVVVGGLVLLCGGCVALVGFSASQSDDLDVFELIEEATYDFSNGVPPAGPTSCEVTGIQTDGTNDYAVDAIVTNADGVTSHYEISYDLLGPGGEFIGSDFGIISDVEPDETVRDFTVGTIDGAFPWTEVTCEVTRALRIDA